MKEKDKDIIYGRHPVLDAIRSGAVIDKLLLQQGTRGEFEKDIRLLSRQYNIPVQVVPKERLNKEVRGNHQGIVGFLSHIRYYKMEDVLPSIFERSETPLLILLDGVTDVRNMGAIARSAECFGAHALVVPRKGGAQINAEAIKASAGALARIPVCRESSLIAAVEFLQMSGVRVMAGDLKASKMLYDLDLKQPVALVAGSEGEGVNPALAQKADELFLIPQHGATNSLNVSVATGIMLYEAVRQRLMGG